MTQVSRYKLSKNTLNRTFDLLIDTLLKINDKDTSQNFVESFFTPTEKIVFAKRLAILVMLAKENSYQSIAYTLKVSPPTIARASMHLKYSDNLTKVINRILAKDSAKLILEEIAGIFYLPGKGRNLRALREINKDRQEKIDRLKKEV